MKIEIQEIDFLTVTKEDARQMRNELHSLELAFNSEKYPKLYELDKLLAGCFNSQVNGVHIISKNHE